jgi:benzoate membrane transport protein
MSEREPIELLPATDATGLAQPVSAGILAALTGFASSFAILLAGFAAVGASPAQAASGLFAVSLGMGLLSIVFSIRWRMPVTIAWSTPGAALLVATGAPAGGYPVAVGAFIPRAVPTDAVAAVRPEGCGDLALLAPCSPASSSSSACPVKAVPATRPGAADHHCPGARLAFHPARDAVAVFVTPSLCLWQRRCRRRLPIPAGAGLIAPAFTLRLIALGLRLHRHHGLAEPPGAAVMHANGYRPGGAGSSSRLPGSRDRVPRRTP